MIKNITRFEHTIADKTIHLMCDCDCNTLTLKEALFQFMHMIGKIEDQAQQQEQEVENPKIENLEDKQE